MGFDPRKGDDVADQAKEAPASQTLSRGIRILEILAAARRPLSIADIAAELEVHRSIAYRLLRTLEGHGLVARDANGSMELAPRMAALAAGVARDLQSQALPELTAIANELSMTCFLGVLDHDEAITIASVTPRHPIAAVAQHPGARHPVTLGATGKAILAAMPESDWPVAVSDELRDEVRDVVRLGYAVSSDEVIPTVKAVAVPLALRGQRPAAISVIYVGPNADAAAVGSRLTASAATIRGEMGQ